MFLADKIQICFKKKKKSLTFSSSVELSVIYEWWWAWYWYTINFHDHMNIMILDYWTMYNLFPGSLIHLHSLVGVFPGFSVLKSPVLYFILLWHLNGTQRVVARHLTSQKKKSLALAYRKRCLCTWVQAFM